MNQKLIHIMASDMKIKRYQGETIEAFTSRVCYSALGIWCLALGLTQNTEHFISIQEQTEIPGNEQFLFGMSKHGMTRKINDIFLEYRTLFPCIQKYFLLNDQDAPGEITTHIREVFTGVGYLETINGNKVRTAPYERSIPIGNKHLFFGMNPQYVGEVYGLGFFLDEKTNFTITENDFLCRDSLRYDEFLDSQYSIVEFEEEDLITQHIEFFNPKLNLPPSRSWQNELNVDKSVARIPVAENRFIYHRVWKRKGMMLFAQEITTDYTGIEFLAYEYRRLYIALKKYYGAPLKARIQKIDDYYSIIKLSGHLPNRDYHFLLLCAWPMDSAFNKTSFLVRNNVLNTMCSVLVALGLDIIQGDIE